MSKTPDDLITTQEAAEVLNESTRTVTRRVESGQLTVERKLPGLRGAYLFKRSTVEQLAAAALTKGIDVA